jgi:hypothetical protein
MFRNPSRRRIARALFVAAEAAAMAVAVSMTAPPNAQSLIGSVI